MKGFTKQSMLATAVVVLAAGGASAQTLKADIPFTFQVGDVVMSPGTYRVVISHTAGERHLIFRNADTNASVLAQYAPGDVPSAWRVRGTPMVKIECSGAQCALREVWPGFDAPAYHFRGP